MHITRFELKCSRDHFPHPKSVSVSVSGYRVKNIIMYSVMDNGQFHIPSSERGKLREAIYVFSHMKVMYEF